MKKVRKAVVPVAGFGTRFLPASKAMPKEMLPVVDKPVIQYVVEELVDAGIEQIIFVTSWHKRAIEDHFDRHPELEDRLERAEKLEQLKMVQDISNMAEFVYVRQKEANGNGDAILTAENVVGDEPFVVVWGDDIFTGTPSRTKQLLDAYEKYQSIVMSCIRTDKPEDTKRYGYIKGEEVEKGVVNVAALIEKPGPENVPSNLAAVGGYVFTPDIFQALRTCKRRKGRELVWVDGMNILKKEGKEAYGIELTNNNYHDCGNVMEYLKTNVELALTRPELNAEFTSFLKKIVNK